MLARWDDTRKSVALQLHGSHTRAKEVASLVAIERCFRHRSETRGDNHAVVDIVLTDASNTVQDQHLRAIRDCYLPSSCSADVVTSLDLCLFSLCSVNVRLLLSEKDEPRRHYRKDVGGYYTFENSFLLFRTSTRRGNITDPRSPSSKNRAAACEHD